MKRLPRSLDELRGLRYAVWVRESTEEQFDTYGPDAQRENVRRFVERYDLVDSGIEYVVAQSGRTVWQSSTMAKLTEDARAGRFDLLLVGYYDRWQRNLRRTLELVEDVLHPSGVAWVMADRRLVSSDPHDWDEMVREAHEAERYSKRLGIRISEGYEAKFRRMADQGGHAPLGFRRVPVGPPGHERHVLAVDEATIARAVAIFERYAAGFVSIERLGREFSLPDRTINDLLKNPVYNGWVRYKGERTAAAWRADPPVPDRMWERVQALLAQRARHGGSKPPKRVDLLRGLLVCECGQRIRTDGLMGTPPRQRKLHPRHDECPFWGEQASYSARTWEDPVLAQMSGIRVDDATIAAVVAVLREPVVTPRSLDRARIDRTRRQLALDHADGRLTDEAYLAAVAALRATPEPEPVEETVSAEAAVARLRDFAATMGSLDEMGEEGATLRAELAAATYGELVVRGPEFIRATLTPDAYAHGFALALPERVRWVLARPTGLGHASTHFTRIEVVGARWWRSTARRLA